MSGCLPELDLPELDASTEGGVAPSVKARADAATDAALDVVVPHARACDESAAVGSGCSTVTIVGESDGSGCRSDEYGLECGGTVFEGATPIPSRTYDVATRVPSSCRYLSTWPAGMVFYCCPCGI